MYVPACLGMYVRCLTKYCVILSSFAGACTHTTKPGRILFFNVGEQDAESSGQSPRYACWARDFRLWISKEKRNLETAVRICSGLLYSFLNFYQSSIFHLACIVFLIWIKRQMATKFLNLFNFLQYSYSNCLSFLH